MVEASRALAYSESLTPPPPPPSSASADIKRNLLSPPPSPRANSPTKDKKN